MNTVVLISPQELALLIENAVNKAIDAKLQLPVVPTDLPEIQNLITRSELLSLLKCSSTTLYNHTKEKKIPSMRLGRRLYYDYNEVMEVMKNQNILKKGDKYVQ